MFKRIQGLAMVMLTFHAAAILADEQPDTDQEKFSYAVGVQLSQNMLRQSISVDPEAFIQAIDDVLNHKDLKLTPEEMQQVLVSYQQQQMQKQSELAATNKTAGEKFLSENKAKPGVVTLPSGLQYKIINAGNGNKPTLDDTVVVHYEGSLLDGKVFDSSYQRGEPIQLQVNGVIKGWQEALPLMPVGAKWQVYIPAELAYGEGGVGGDIGPNSTLLFDIELISIN